MNEAGESPAGSSDCVSLTLSPTSSSSTISINDTERESESVSSTRTAVVAGGDGVSSNSTRSLKSILRTSGRKRKRNVHFADDIDQDLATYREPCGRSEWTGVQHYANVDIVESYFRACCNAHTIVQDSIREQLRAVKNNRDYSATLNLTELTVDSDVVETLETIFKMVTFRTMYLGRVASGYAINIFDMLEFYDPVKELVLSGLSQDNHNMWHSFASAVANSEVLFSTSFREMNIGDQSLGIIFIEGINFNSTVKRVRFDGCGLSRAPTFMLGHHLKCNEYLHELHLCFLDLFSKEAEILGKFLSINSSLRVLNLSNNKLGDHGFELLSHGLFDQVERGIGVEVLILFNNQLTRRCIDTLDAVISVCPLVHTINVGLNNLTDIAIYKTKTSIAKSLTLRALGLQSTLITCHGILALAEACEKNSSLRHLNLRGNKAIQPDSLNVLADVIHKTSLIQIDLDDNNRSCCNPQKYAEIVNKVRQVVAINKAKVEAEHPDELGNKKWNQEAYLNCEPAYVPQSHPCLRSSQSPSSNSSLRHRFSVEPVTESASAASRSSTSHRFTVIPSTSACIDSERYNTSRDTLDICDLKPTNNECSPVKVSVDKYASGDPISPSSQNDARKNVKNPSPYELGGDNICKNALAASSHGSGDAFPFLADTDTTVPSVGSTLPEERD